MNHPEDPKQKASYRLDEDVEAQIAEDMLDQIGVENPPEDEEDGPVDSGTSELDEFGMPKIASTDMDIESAESGATERDDANDPMAATEADFDVMPDLEPEVGGGSGDDHDDLHAKSDKGSFWQHNKLAIGILAGTVVVAGGGWGVWSFLGSGSPPPTVSQMSGAERSAIERAYESMHEEAPALDMEIEDAGWGVDFDDFESGPAMPPPAATPMAAPPTAMPSPVPDSPGMGPSVALPNDGTLEVAADWVLSDRLLDVNAGISEITLVRNAHTEGLRPGDILISEDLRDEVMQIAVDANRIVVRTRAPNLSAGLEALAMDSPARPAPRSETVNEPVPRGASIAAAPTTGMFEPEVAALLPPTEAAADPSVRSAPRSAPAQATPDSAAPAPRSAPRTPAAAPENAGGPSLLRQAVSPRSEQVAIEDLRAELEDERALAQRLAGELDLSVEKTESLTITIDEQKDRIAELERQVASLRRERTRLQERLETPAKSAQTTAPAAERPAPRPAPPAPTVVRAVEPEAPVGGDWRISAMSAGQALLLSGSGEYYAVTEGDRLPELGVVHRIDEERGRIVTERAVLQR